MFLWLNGKEYNVLLNLKVDNAISLSLVLVQSNKVQQDTVGLTTFYPILYNLNINFTHVYQRKLQQGVKWRVYHIMTAK